MIDLARGVLVIASALASLRARYLPGAVLAIVTILLMAGEVFLVFLYPVEPLPLPLAIASVIFGPSALPNSAPLFGAEFGNALHHLLPAALVDGSLWSLGPPADRGCLTIHDQGNSSAAHVLSPP